VDFEGARAPWITGKDFILALLGRIGVQGARYAALEFGGSAVKDLPLDDRFTVANMAVEGGAKVGIFVPDETILAYAKTRGKRPFEAIYPDEGAPYAQRLEIDVAALEPLVAAPSSPGNMRRAAELSNTRVDQVFLGSCTNGRLRDMELAAKLLKGRRVADSVRCIVIPASYEVFAECMKRGYLDIFIEAGAAVSTPTCGPCLGGHMGILAAGERCLATSNRNFVGRMGHPQSEVYLAGPLVAAATAVTGRITDPRELVSGDFWKTL
jgi:3-isopropylmalate/(R)-2-methylmalate dehydratase large subunit